MIPDVINKIKKKWKTTVMAGEADCASKQALVGLNAIISTNIWFTGATLVWIF